MVKRYVHVEPSERQLEDLIRQAPDLIEADLKYLDHQRGTDRGPLDVLMVDSGGALVVAELKIVEDDSMLVQGLDYYDFVVRNIEAICRVYADHNPDPRQAARLFLIAPSFSVTLLNRCKWLDAPISLFTFKCIKMDGDDDVTPVFSEVNAPSLPKPVQSYKIEDLLAYMTDAEARDRLRELIAKVKAWRPGSITAEPIKYDVSLKVGGRVFAYFSPRRKHFMVYTFDPADTWTGYPITGPDDIEQVEPLLTASVERRGRQ